MFPSERKFEIYLIAFAWKLSRELSKNLANLNPNRWRPNRIFLPRRRSDFRPNSFFRIFWLLRTFGSWWAKVRFLNEGLSRWDEAKLTSWISRRRCHPFWLKIWINSFKNFSSRFKTVAFKTFVIVFSSTNLRLY